MSLHNVRLTKEQFTLLYSRIEASDMIPQTHQYNLYNFKVKGQQYSFASFEVMQEGINITLYDEIATPLGYGIFKSLTPSNKLKIVNLLKSKKQ